MEISRQQFNSMLARALAQREVTARGGIRSASGLFVALDEWFEAEGRAMLTPFADAYRISGPHRATSAYLVFRSVIQGRPMADQPLLDPIISLTRAQPWP